MHSDRQTKPIDQASAQQPAASQRQSVQPIKAQTSVPTPSARISPDVIRRLTMVFDAALTIVIGVILHKAYLQGATAFSTHYQVAMLLCAIAVVSIFAEMRLYKLNVLMQPVANFRHMLKGIFFVFTALIAIIFALKISATYSRVWLFSWWIAASILLPLSRVGVAGILSNLSRRGNVRRNLVVFGTGPVAQKFISHIQRSTLGYNHIVGIFDDRTTRREPDLCGLPVLGNSTDLVHFVREHRVDQIVVSLPWSADNRILEIRNQLNQLPVDVGLAPGLMSYSLQGARTSRVAGIPLLELSRRPISDWSAIQKRCFDLLLTIPLILGFLPVIAVIALLIKIGSKGPVLFRQKRFGFNNQLIDVLKFRTMYVEQQDDNATKLATKNDPRITPIGRFLRRWSMDELPQLFNVLNGSMSLVGPRPHATQAKAANRLYTELLDNYASRHRVLPGITGWAQVQGWRGETDTEAKLVGRVEHDLVYIDTWSLWLDVQILLLTFQSVIKGENAY